MNERKRVKQLMKNSSFQFPKLQHSKQITPPGKRINQTQYVTMSQDTIRKIRHLNTPQNQNLTTIKAQKEHSKSQMQEKIKTPTKEKPNTEISNIPLRQKFKHLLPQEQKNKLPYQHQFLIKIQRTVDQHLQFCRQIRGKKKGILVSQMRQNIAQSAHFLINLSHIKQINYLVPDFYNFYEQRTVENKYDVRIMMNNTTQSSLIARKRTFKQRIYKYLKEHDGINIQSDKLVTIPQKNFAFQGKIIQTITKTECIDKSKLICQPSQKKSIELEDKKINPFDVLDKYLCNSFKQKLFQKVREEQKRLKQLQKQRKKRANQFGKDEILDVLHKVHMSYLSKAISNMFKTTLLQLIQKKSLLTQDALNNILSIIIKKGQQTGYATIVNHRQGMIIQIQKTLYAKVRASITEQQVYYVNQIQNCKDMSSNLQEHVQHIDQPKEYEEQKEEYKGQLDQRKSMINKKYGFKDDNPEKEQIFNF